MGTKRIPAYFGGNYLTIDWVENVFDNHDCCHGYNSDGNEMYLGLIAKEPIMCVIGTNYLIWESLDDHSTSYLDSLYEYINNFHHDEEKIVVRTSQHGNCIVQTFFITK